MVSMKNKTHFEQTLSSNHVNDVKPSEVEEFVMSMSGIIYNILARILVMSSYDCVILLKLGINIYYYYYYYHNKYCQNPFRSFAAVIELDGAQGLVISLISLFLCAQVLIS